MLTWLKKIAYFPLASYFRFLAKIKLSRWNPKIVVVTGSIGKTTQFELLKSQISKDDAYFAEHVNSVYGIPANILGLEIGNSTGSDWIRMFFEAPFAVFTKHPSQRIAIFEADCDRPGEGKFLASLLKPDTTIWVSSTITHSANFDHLKNFNNVEQAIAFEFGYFAEYTKSLVIANCDFEPVIEQLTRSKAKVIQIKDGMLKDYKVTRDGTTFDISGEKYTIPTILPDESFFSIIAAKTVLEHLGLRFDPSFKNFQTPAGRGTLFKGINNSIIIDSSYNASKNAVLYFLEILDQMAKTEKTTTVFVMGDMRELGHEAEQEHKEVVNEINKVVDRLVCVGPLTKQYVIPNTSVESQWFENSKQAGEYLKQNMPENAVVLVKGSQNKIFLERTVEQILADPADIKKLSRRGEFWDKQRQLA